MSDYSQVTDFSDKDALTTGDPEKAISGADVDGELGAISTAIATKIDEPVSPSTNDHLVWSGSAWIAKDNGADGSAGQVRKTNGTASSWGWAPNLGTEQATSSGTSKDFTSIPSGVRQIVVMLEGVSTDGTAELLIQLGDAGGIEATGYLGSGGEYPTGLANTSTTGFAIGESLQAADVVHGAITLYLKDATAFTWVAAGTCAYSNGGGILGCAGSKSLSAELTQLRITTIGGTDNFDAGSVNIQYY